ncbi:MAG: class I SAM-dependent methyltransferase [Actinomycetota bacterium]|nr:class I SAM-dependent methyltransferase [Actinomycetota bacterium]
MDDAGVVAHPTNERRSVADAVADAYLGAAWAEGPGLVYDLLAAALVSARPDPLVGLLVLDLGAGAGAASRAVASAGGNPIAVDVAFDMLRHDRGRRPPAVVGDGGRLPFKNGAFGAVVMAFVLSHVPDPARMLADARRVTSPGGMILASSFSSRSSHPAKIQVDDVAAQWGWQAPPWYERLKSEFEPRVATLDALADLARSAGLHDVIVEEREVSTGISSPEVLVAWRLGMAHLAPFVAALPGPERARLLSRAQAAVGDRPHPLRPVMLVLSSRAPARRERSSA